MSSDLVTHEALDRAPLPHRADTSAFALYDAVTDGITVIDASGQLAYANAEAARMCGFPNVAALLATAPDAVLGRFEILDDDGGLVSPTELPTRVALAGQEPRERLVRFRPQGAEEDRHAWVNARRLALRDASYVVTTFRDATEVARAHARFRAVIEQAPAAIAFWRGREHVFEVVNPRYCELVDKQESDLIGRKLREVFPSLSDADVAHLDQVYATGEPQRFDEYELPVKSAPGTGFFSLNVQPVRGARGGVAGVMVIIVDESEQVRARRHIRESQRRYEQILDSVQEMVFTKAPGSVVTYANRAAEKHYGMTKEQLRGITDAPSNKPELTEQYVKDDQRVFATGESIEIPNERNVRHDGEVRVFHTVKSPIRDDAGNVAEIVGVSRDVTEQRKNEREALDQQRRLALALEAGQLGVFEWNVAAGRVIWSPEVERAHGIPIGSFDGTFEMYKRDIHPEDVAHVLETTKANLERKGDHHLTYRIVRPDGEVRWLEAFGRFVLDDNGNVERLIGVCRDVTERQLAEQRQAALVAENRLARYAELRARVGSSLARNRELHPLLQECCEALVGGLPFAFARIWTVDRSGEWLELQGSAGMYTHIDGPHARVKIGEYKIGRIAAARAPHLSNNVPNDPWVSDHAWARAERMVSFAGYPIVSGERLIGVMAAFSHEPLTHDTLSAMGIVADTLAQGLERLRAELELEERARDLARSNSELEQFAYVASHDLQEPLRMVASYNQLLARRYKGKLDESADEFIGYTVEGVTRMQRLINDLLSYSRVGTRVREFESVDTGQVLGIALQNLSAAIKESAAVVTHDDMPTVHADDGQLLQLFQNLVANAIKFRREEEAPRIHVGAKKDGNDWVFSVADNGIGVDPQYFERIFVIFQRLNARERYPGTGIGLAIAKKIVERHRGRIWIDSTVGKGSTIYFSIPAMASPTKVPS